MRKLKQVEVVTHTFKHGSDVYLYDSRKKAEAKALRLMEARVPSWFASAAEKFNLMSDFATKFHFFHEIESNISEGGRIKIVRKYVE